MNLEKLLFRLKLELPSIEMRKYMMVLEKMKEEFMEIEIKEEKRKAARAKKENLINEFSPSQEVINLQETLKEVSIKPIKKRILKLKTEENYSIVKANEDNEEFDEEDQDYIDSKKQIGKMKGVKKDMLSEITKEYSKLLKKQKENKNYDAEEADNQRI